MRSKLPILLLLLLARTAVAFADSPVEHAWSRAFGSPAIDRNVNCAVRWGGGIVIGGDFTLAGVVPARNLAWWDGRRWLELGGGVDGPVRCLAVVGGRLVVGGDFEHAGGVDAPGIVSWSGGHWIPMGAGLTGPYHLGAHALATYHGELVAVGGFTNSGETPIPSAARWDGAAWHALGQGLSNGEGRSAAVYHDQLYVAGTFDGVDGTPAQGLAAWDGAHWSPVPWSSPTYTFWNGIAALAVAHDRLYAGGDFARADTVEAINLAAWDGNAWSAVPRIPGYGITALASHKDTLTVASSYGGSLWNWDGAKLTPSPSNLKIEDVTSLLIDDAGAVVTGFVGALRSTETLGYQVLVRTGSSDWSPLQTWSSAMHGSAPRGSVQAFTRYKGDILAAGFETVAAGGRWTRVDGLARWDGSGWRSFPGWPAGFGSIEGAYASGDTLVVVGSFLEPQHGNWALPGFLFDGAHWTPLDTLSSALRCPTLYRGALYVGGQPSQGDLRQAGGVYRLNGTHWTKIADITSSLYNIPSVFAMAVHDDRLVVGGWFDHIDGVAATNVAAWDGATWAPFGELPEGSVSPPVLDLVEVDTTLYVAGGIGSSYDAVMRWDGSAWQGMGLKGVSFGIEAFDGRLHAVAYRYDRGIDDHELLSWDGTDWTTLGTLNDFSYAMLSDGESLWLGGRFSMVDGIPSSYIARWGRAPALPGAGIALGPAVPNPTRGSVAFSYVLPTAGDVLLTVSDARGRHVATLESGPRDAGEHSALWDGKGQDGQRLPAGLYFARLVMPGGKESGRKIVLLP
jgi:hypothetical protein